MRCRHKHVIRFIAREYQNISELVMRVLSIALRWRNREIAIRQVILWHDIIRAIFAADFHDARNNLVARRKILSRYQRQLNAAQKAKSSD